MTFLTEEKTLQLFSYGICSVSYVMLVLCFNRKRIIQKKKFLNFCCLRFNINIINNDLHIPDPFVSLFKNNLQMLL